MVFLPSRRGKTAPPGVKSNVMATPITFRPSWFSSGAGDVDARGVDSVSVSNTVRDFEVPRLGTGVAPGTARANGLDESAVCAVSGGGVTALRGATSADPESPKSSMTVRRFDEPAAGAAGTAAISATVLRLEEPVGLRSAPQYSQNAAALLFTVLHSGHLNRLPPQ